MNHSTIYTQLRGLGGTVLFLTLLLLAAPLAYAQGPPPNPAQAMWNEMGGKMIFKGEHEFKKGWTTNSGWWRTGKLWYKIPDEEDAAKKLKPPPKHTDEEVNKAVQKKLATVKVMGPGRLLAYVVKESGGWVRFNPLDPDFRVSVGIVEAYNPSNWRFSNGEFNWKNYPINVSKPEEAVLDVVVGMVEYNNMSNTGEFSYRAPQKIYVELWWFPTGGGGIVDVTTYDEPEPVPPFIPKPKPEPDPVPKPKPDPVSPPPGGSGTGPGTGDMPPPSGGGGTPDNPPGVGGINTPPGGGGTGSVVELPVPPGIGTGGPGLPSGEMRVRAEDRYVRAAKTVIVPVWLDNAVDIANINVEVRYDAAVVQPAGNIVQGSVIGNALFQANAGETGVMRIGFAGKRGFNGTGTLAQLPFLAAGAPGSKTVLDVVVTTINNANGDRLSVRDVDGSITVLTAGGALPGGSGPVQIPLGDINGNGIIDAGDALAALKMSVDLMKEDLILNIDQNDGVTSNDARILLKKAAQGGVMTGGSPGTAAGGSGPASPPGNASSGANVAPQAPSQASTGEAGQRAYQDYIAAYNRMTSLMAAGKGDTPEAQQAYTAFQKAKTIYEADLASRPVDH